MSLNESGNSSVDSCNCSDSVENKNDVPHCCNNLQELKNKKSNGLTLLAQNLRRGRSLNFTNKRVRKCGRQVKEPASAAGTSKKSPKWVMKFNCAKKDRAYSEDNRKCCVCTCYRRTDENQLGAGYPFPLEEALPSCEETSEEEKKEEEKEEVQEVQKTAHVISEEITLATTNSDVYGNLGGANSASIILGAPLLDISW